MLPEVQRYQLKQQCLKTSIGSLVTFPLLPNEPPAIAARRIRSALAHMPYGRYRFSVCAAWNSVFVVKRRDRGEQNLFVLTGAR